MVWGKNFLQQKLYYHTIKYSKLTVTDASGQYFAKKGEVKQVIAVDAGVRIWLIQPIDTLKQGILRVETLQDQQMKEFPNDIDTNKNSCTSIQCNKSWYHASLPS